MKEKYRKIMKITVISLLSFIVLIGAFLLYASDYYHSDTTAIEEFVALDDVSKTYLYDGAILYEKEPSEVGFIFYPGGKVEYTAYEPLMYELASKGISCILLEMPFNLAVLNVNAAKKTMDLLPEIKQWLIGGHSLGGSMAATFFSNNVNQFEGLVLLGSYSTSDLSSFNTKVLSIYGSLDNIMNRDKYEKYKVNLPNDFTEIVIEGGCHAYFGMYGLQKGDGTPTISAEEQIILTADYIFNFFK